MPFNSRSKVVRGLLLLFALFWLRELATSLKDGWAFGARGLSARRDENPGLFYVCCAGYALVAAGCLYGALRSNPVKPGETQPKSVKE